NPETVMNNYFRLGSRLELNWLRNRSTERPRAKRWQALARAALRDDLDSLHRALTQEVVAGAGTRTDSDAAIEAWLRRNQKPVERCLGILGDVKASRVYDTTTLPV